MLQSLYLASSTIDQSSHYLSKSFTCVLKYYQNNPCNTILTLFRGNIGHGKRLGNVTKSKPMLEPATTVWRRCHGFVEEVFDDFMSTCEKILGIGVSVCSKEHAARVQGSSKQKRSIIHPVASSRWVYLQIWQLVQLYLMQGIIIHRL